MKDIYWKENLLAKIKALNPGSSEFLVMISELIDLVHDYMQAHPVYHEAKIIERLIEPEQMHLFRVCWRDDAKQLHVNKGYYIKMSATLGTPQGRLRFHPSINLGMLKALALETTLQNSLTGLPLGGAVAAADLDAKNKSDAEIMRFCQAFMTELYSLIGPDAGVLYGDTGVGQREIGYLFGQYKKLSGRFEAGVLDKHLDWGGTQLRLEASGYSAAYFLQAMLQVQNDSLKGKRVNISGAKQLALHVAEKLINLGAVVQTLSDSSGCLYFAEGLKLNMLRDIKEHKLLSNKSLQHYAHEHQLTFYAGREPWSLACEIALPCREEEEIDIKDAEFLSDNHCLYMVEGLSRACDLEARQWLLKHDVQFVPGKLSTLGSAIIHALELSQNGKKLSSSAKDLDEELQKTTEKIHQDCVNFCTNTVKTDYIKAADTMSFVRIANAMLEQGDH